LFRCLHPPSAKPPPLPSFLSSLYLTATVGTLQQGDSSHERDREREKGGGEREVGSPYCAYLKSVRQSVAIVPYHTLLKACASSYITVTTVLLVGRGCGGGSME
jgi:hypothetical protein